MKLRRTRLGFIMVIAAVAICLGGCKTMSSFMNNMTNDEPAGATVDTMAATTEDMRKLISGNKVPFSKYLVKVGGKGYLVIPGKSGQGDIVLKPQGENMLVTLPFDLAKEAGLVANTDMVPVTGGWGFGNKVAVVPGIYSPVACVPSWLPSGISMSIDASGKLDLALSGKFKSETEKLVSYMEMTKLLGGTSADVIGHFTTVPQLKKLLDQMKQDTRSDPDLSVLNATGANPFALVIVRRSK